MTLARTYLFVPGNRPERFAKALASSADAVVLDLEDAVAADAKACARNAVADWAAHASAADLGRAVLRINHAGSAEFDEDCRLLREAGVAGAMLAKAETAQQVRQLRTAVPGISVLALIESAPGVANATAVAAAPGVSRLVFRTLDYALDLDHLDISERSDPLLHAAACLALASRLADLPAPVAGVTPQIDDQARLDGQMVDRPVVLRAQRLLQRAGA